MTDDVPKLFAVFNEIGIVSQLANAAFETRLPPGLLVSHFSVVNHLIRVGDGATPLSLARAFQVPKTTMTHTLSGLVKHGFVEMRPNPNDARSKQVWLTELGRVFRQNAIEALMPDLLQLGAEMPDLVDEVLAPLQKLRMHLDENRLAGGPKPSGLTADAGPTNRIQGVEE